MKNEKLIEFRKSKGLSQTAMAKKLEISLSMYSQMESGCRNPSLETLQKFADNFDDFDIGIFLHKNTT